MTTLIWRLAFVMLQPNCAKLHDTLNVLMVLHFGHLVCSLWWQVSVRYCITCTALKELCLALLGTYTGCATAVPLMRGCRCCMHLCSGRCPERTCVLAVQTPQHCPTQAVQGF